MTTTSSIPANTVSPTSSAATTGTSKSVLDDLSVRNAKAKVSLPEQTKVSLDSFLNLLVTQLKNQDPLQPVQNTEFITQLAQFQSLSTQLDSAKNIQDLVGLQQSQLALSGLSQAALLVGKNVTWTDKDGKSGSGTVSSVTVENGVMMINTEHGKVPVGALTSLGLGPQGGGTGPGAGAGSGNDGPVATTTPADPSLVNAGPNPLIPAGQLHRNS